MVTVRQGPAVETPDWLKDVTASRTPSVERETRPSDEARTPDEDDEPSAPPAAAEPVAETRRPLPVAEPARKRPVAGTAAAAAETSRSSGTPDAGALLATAPPTQVRERLRAIGKRGPSEVTLAEQLGLKFRRVVIDPGHGGHDNGTIGEGGVKEKDVALAIAKKLRSVLTDQGLEVVLTRETDRFVRLEERTRIANAARGDLFISVHCNSLPQRHIRGIETYTLNLASNHYAIRLAARENATSEKGMSDLQFLLADLATRANTEESVRLATQVQSGLVSSLQEQGQEDPRPRHQGGALLRAPRDQDAGHPGGDRLPLQPGGGEAPGGDRVPGGRGPGHRLGGPGLPRPSRTAGEGELGQGGRSQLAGRGE